MIHEGHTTEIQVGDRFEFRGLTGQEVEDEITLRIEKITLTGDLLITGIVILGPNHTKFTSRHDVDINTALEMIDQNIWKAIEEE
jgi:hypothetical protein